MRRFAAIKEYEGKVNLPERKTAHSAGYDIESAETVIIKPGEVKRVPTGLKVYMNDGEVLMLHPRSSLVFKKSLLLITGVIDKDYVDNSENEGHIQLVLFNVGSEEVVVNKGDRIANGIFMHFLTVDDDSAEGKRVGGFGSTD